MVQDSRNTILRRVRMQNAMWLASIFGPFLIIVGLWMLLYSENMLKIVSSIKGSPAALYTSGIINLLVGLTILSNYDTWSWDAYVLVTLLGWVMLIRGVMVLFVPQLLIQLTMTNRTLLKAWGILPLFWGLALSWVAFFM
jgi:hypothetical protein